MDKRLLAVTFRDRLRILMDRARLNQSQMARITGVDRSSFAQLLSEQSPRLPRAETLIAIAETQGASLDWLLGLTQQDDYATTEVSETMAIEEGARGADNSRLQAWRAEAAGTKVRYVPATLPDLLRLPEVVDYEAQNLAEPSRETRKAQDEDALDYNRRLDTDMEVCMPRQTIEGLIGGHHIWAGLPAPVRAAQLRHMARLVDELYPTFRLYLFDEHTAFSSPYTVFGQQRVAFYLGDIYLVITQRETIRRMTKHFDQLIRNAVVPSHEAARALHEMAGA